MNDLQKECEALKEKLAEQEARIESEQNNDNACDFSIHIASLKYMAKKMAEERLRKYWFGVKEDANE